MVSTEKPRLEMPTLGTVSTIISSAGAVIAAVCAIISTSQLLKAVQTDAQEKVFALKLDACDAFGETTTIISTNPMAAASNDEVRRKMVRSANRLVMLFPEPVGNAGVKFINQMDIVYNAARGGSQDVSLGMRLGSEVQAAVDLELACQDEIKRSAHISR